jgi:hypothetical protein
MASVIAVGRIPPTEENGRSRIAGEATSGLITTITAISMIRETILPCVVQRPAGRSERRPGFDLDHGIFVIAIR